MTGICYINKKIIKLLIAAILLIMTGAAAVEISAMSSDEMAAAKAKAYTFEQFDITIEIPDDLAVFTQDIDTEDPKLKKYNFDEKILENDLKERNIYIYALNYDSSFKNNGSILNKNSTLSLALTLKEDSSTKGIKDFNSLSDDELNSYITGFSTSSLSGSIDMIESGVYKHKQTKFVMMNYIDNSTPSTSYGLQYNTIYKGKGVKLVMFSYDDEITDADKKYLLDIVDSINFTDEKEILYRDTDTGTTFTVPAGWFLDDNGNMTESHYAYFWTKSNTLDSIIYTSTDLWQRMSDEEKAVYPRSVINNDILTNDDFPESLGIQTEDKNKLKYVTYNGIEYSEYRVVESYDEGESQINSLILYHIRDGISYTFRLYGLYNIEENPYYSDFISVLESVEYPPLIDETASGKKTSDKTTADKTAAAAFAAENLNTGFDINDKNNMMLCLLVIAAIYLIPVAIYRFLIRKRPVSPKTAKVTVIIYLFSAIFIVYILQIILRQNINGYLSGITAGVSFLCSYINYRILVIGNSSHMHNGKVIVPETSPETATGKTVTCDEILEKPSDKENENNVIIVNNDNTPQK